MDKHEDELQEKIKESLPQYKWGSTTPEWQENTEIIARLKELVKQKNHK